MRRLLCTLFLAVSLNATPAFVRKVNCSGNGGSGTTASASCSFPTLPAIGNMVGIMGGAYGALVGPATDNQGGGNTYIQLVLSGTGGSTQGGMWAATVVASNGTFTITLANATEGTVLFEFSGMPATIAVDTSASTNAAACGTTNCLMACGSGLVTTQTDLMLTGFYVHQDGNVQVNSIGSGFPTLIVPESSGYKSPLVLGFSYLTGAAGTYHPDFTLSPNYNMNQGSYFCAAVKTTSGAAAYRRRSYGQ